MKEKVNVTVKGVKLIVTEDSADVKLRLNKEIPGRVRKNDENVDANVKDISIPRSALTAQLCENSDDIAYFKAVKGKAFTQHDLGAILFNAKLKIEFEKIEAKAEYTNYDGSTAVAEHTFYQRSVTSCEITDRAKELIEKSISLSFE